MNTHIQAEVEKLNKITENELFYFKTGKKMTFYIKQSLFNKILTKNITLLTIKITNRFNEVFYKQMKLNHFLNFNNNLLNCLFLFYGENIIKRSINPNKADFELCCICEDNTPQVVLDCYVLLYIY